MPRTRLARLVDLPERVGLFPSSDPIRPEWFGGRHERQLGRAVGVSQFGVNHVTLEPGAYSALRHWHEDEDELVHVLFGELMLIDDNGEHPLSAGDTVGFPAGEANAHHLVNRSTAPASFLAIGTRRRGEERIHYPDDPEMGVGRVVRGEDGERLSAPWRGSRRSSETSPTPAAAAPRSPRRRRQSPCAPSPLV